MNPSQDRISLLLGQIGKRVIDASKKSRKRTLETGNEIMKYGYSPDYGFEYQKKAPNAFFKAKVALTAEAFAVFGPYLFPQVPVRTVTPRPWASPEQARRGEIVAQLLNYTPGETGLRDEARRAILDAIGYGRGVHWIGRDAKSGLICSMWDSVKNFGTDPDARTKRERKFVWRRRIMPRFEAIATLPQAKAALMKEPVYEMRPTDLDGRFAWENQDTAAECICYYELYSIVGLHNYKGGSELAKALGGQSTDTGAQGGASGEQELEDRPLKYLISESGKLLAVQEWEVPFFEDGMFPCNELDLLDNPDSDWPESVLAAGLGWQRAINWLVTMLIGKFRFTSRTVGALAKNGVGVNEKDKEKLLRVGGDIDLIEIQVNGETRTLQNFIQQFDWNHDYLNWGMQFLELMESRFQKSTGLYDILYAGDADRQMRSAQEAQLKERNSRSRIDDMKDRVAEWMAKGARMEALASRFLLKREDVAKILGPQAGQDWGFLVAPEAKDAEQWAMQNMAAGMPVEEAVMMAQQQLAQAVSLDEWRMELDYTIEAGSMRRNDIDGQIDGLRELMNPTGAAMIQSPDPRQQAIGLDTVAELIEKLGLNQKLVAEYRDLAAQLRMPPPMVGPDGLPLPIPGPGSEPEPALQETAP